MHRYHCCAVTYDDGRLLLKSSAELPEIEQQGRCLNIEQLDFSH